ncbi:conjugative transposon protein TraK [Cruoricaptor ignavus]|uniref:Conjugative transposon protein TraK n=1 Tax=Cruoricaptor ignavus TaxID=1118202 RepID=A0A7M1T6L5_9FLAO|nr:conjugative transposon protein TraK [Cruoricaptor ignavus]QOR74613.1 conjugative transposon protein TraK [Cruoricaptor ignavus]
MALIKNIEEKIKINRTVSIASIVAALIVSTGAFITAYSMVRNAQKSIYILDNGVPLLVKQTDEMLNRPVEYKSQVELFHRMFFTLAPDDEFIRENIEKSLYLIDDSGKKEYANLRDRGFYNQLIASSGMMTMHTDSIQLDMSKKFFRYFGRQVIIRKTSVITRNLITEGALQDIIRSPKNPHGVLLTNWRIIDNTEITNRER